MISMWTKVLLLALCPRTASGQCVDPGAASCAAEAAGDPERTSLLQTSRSKAPQDLAPDTCGVGDHVPCPGSGNMCAGDQCCPGVNATGNLTFPCPSASAAFAGCEQEGKVGNCLTVPIAPGPVGEGQDVHWGDDVVLIKPGALSPEVRKRLKDLEERQWMDTDDQFNPEVYRPTAVFLYPGDHHLDFKVPYYVSVIGLGKLPTETVLHPGDRGIGLEVDCDKLPHGSLNTFWRSVENLRLTQKTFKWWVSQAAPLRSLHIDNDLMLAGDQPGQYASGGAMMNSFVGGSIKMLSQQQWYARSMQMPPYERPAGIGSYVCAGCIDHAGKSFEESWNQPKHHGLSNYDMSEKVFVEKPYIAVDDTGEFSMMFPDERSPAGPSWRDNRPPPSYSFHRGVFVARPGISGKEINAQINKHNKDIVFTPGVYKLDDNIRIKDQTSCVLLGLGFATLVPDYDCEECSLIQVDNDSYNVRIAGLMLQTGGARGATNAALLQWGFAGADQSHVGVRGYIYDLCARSIGADYKAPRDGPQSPSGASAFVEINSPSVVGDNLWLWNADHCGSKATWPCTASRVSTGLLVRGTGVRMYGLMAEHAQGDIVYWSGEDGEVVFLQVEFRYGMGPKDADKLAPRSNVAYLVDAKRHTAVGGGIYLVVNPKDTQGGLTYSSKEWPLHMSGGFAAIWVDHESTYREGFKDFSAKNFYSKHLVWPVEERITCKVAGCRPNKDCSDRPALDSSNVICYDTHDDKPTHF